MLVNHNLRAGQADEKSTGGILKCSQCSRRYHELDASELGFEMRCLDCGGPVDTDVEGAPVQDYAKECARVLSPRPL